MTNSRFLNLVFPLVLICGLTACPGGSTPPPGGGAGNLDDLTFQLPSSRTDVGAPLSSNVASPFPMIGPDGGSFNSEDQRLTLVVPPGAVTDYTTFGLQLIENRLPGGLGLAYRVTAKNAANEVATLLQPLELDFNLEAYDLSDTPAEDLATVYQGPDGRWQISTDVQLALSPRAGPAKQLKASLKQLGDYALGARYKLYPAKGSVKVNGSLLLTVLKLSPSATDPNSGYAPVDVTKLSASNWAVNGVVGGNAGLGILIAEDVDSQKRFKAPARKPSPNPVRVTALVNDAGRTATVASSIRVEDSQGWVSVYADVTHRENQTGTDGSFSTLTVNANAQYQLEVTKSNVSAPGSVLGNAYPGFASYELALSPGASATAKIKFESLSRGPCVCSPKTGMIEIHETYEFTAADVPQLLMQLSASGQIEPDGSYKLQVPIAVRLEGDYTYQFSEVYPCGDRDPRSPKNQSGKDTVTFAAGSNIYITVSGKVKPQGPDRITGTASYTLPVAFTLPGSMGGRVVRGTFIPNWYFAYEPVGTQSQASVPAQDIPMLPLLPAVQPSLLEPERGVVRPKC